VLITRPEESYLLWCVVVCDLEKTSRTKRPWSALDRSAKKMAEQYIYSQNAKFRLTFLFRTVTVSAFIQNSNRYGRELYVSFTFVFNCPVSIYDSKADPSSRAV
jgi:hypothetical protein